MTMTEEWRDIEGYEGAYQVSNLGNVKTLSWHQTGEQRLLKQVTHYKGYKEARLSKNGKMKTFFVHRLVCKAFIPNPNNYSEINHKDENKLNNRADNLEWCDRKYNINYGTAKQRIHNKMVNNPKRSKRVGQYDLEGNLIAMFDSVREVERRLGFCNGDISRCCVGKSRHSHGYLWRHI